MDSHRRDSYSQSGKQGSSLSRLRLLRCIVIKQRNDFSLAFLELRGAGVST